MADDALIAHKLNKSNGFPKQRDSDKKKGIAPVGFRKTTYTHADGDQRVQEFVFIDEKTGERQHKGLEMILIERGKYRKAGPGVKAMSLQECIDVLSAEPDFRAQVGKTWLVEVCAKVGITAVYGVVFHPEIAAIEYYWGECKRYTRRNCDYSIETLRITVPEALVLCGALPYTGSVEEVAKRLSTIRRHFAHVERYMDAYELGTLTPAQLEWCMHRYTSHRRTKDCNIEELERDWLSSATRAQMPLELQQEKVSDVDAEAT